MQKAVLLIRKMFPFAFGIHMVLSLPTAFPLAPVPIIHYYKGVLGFDSVTQMDVYNK